MHIVHTMVCTDPPSHFIVAPAIVVEEPPPFNARSLSTDTGAKYLARSQSAGNRKIMTFSAFVKMPAGGSGDGFNIALTSSTTLRVNWDGSAFGITLSGTGFSVGVKASGDMSPSTWYHILVQINTTVEIDASRVRIFINGLDETDESSTFPTEEQELGFGWGGEAETVALVEDGTALWKIEELAKFDGQIYGRSAVATVLGEPKDLSSLVFGASGYWLRFETGVGATAGADSSGNANDFSNNNYLDEDFSTDLPPAFNRFALAVDSTIKNLSHVPNIGTSRKTMTFSFFVKTPSSILSNSMISLYNANEFAYVIFGDTGSVFQVVVSSNSASMDVFSDTGLFVPVADTWYHVCIELDTTQAVGTDRVKIIVNNANVTDTAGSTYPVQNTNTEWGDNTLLEFHGVLYGTEAVWAIDEIVKVDGQVLPAATFIDNVFPPYRPIDISALDFGNDGYWLRFEEAGAEQDPAALGVSSYSSPAAPFNLQSLSSDDSTKYLLRTQGVGNRKTFTISAWVKTPDTVDQFNFYHMPNDSNLYLAAGGVVVTFEDGASGSVATTAFTPVPNTWYHVVIQIDTTQVLDTDRVKLIVDGFDYTDAGSTYPSLDYETEWGADDTVEQICRAPVGGQLWRVDEFAKVDGQIYAPSDFVVVGVPKNLSGLSFGSEGYWLRFEVVGNGNEGGFDYSGNSNDFTCVNIVSGDGSAEVLAYSTDFVAVNFTLADIKPWVP